MHVNDIGTGGFCKKIEIIVGFLHEHKLSHEQEFNAVLKGGTAITSYPLRFLYIAEQAESANFQVAISVPKKHFHNAVDRNLLNRRIRESFDSDFNCILQQIQNRTSSFGTKNRILFSKNS